MPNPVANLSLDEMEKDISLPLLPDTYRLALKRIHSERKKILSTLEHCPPVYGFNRLPGHRDHVTIGDQEIKQFHERFLESHLIGGVPYLSPREVRYIGYAKLKQILSGHTGISKETAKSLLSSLNHRSIDEAIIPASDTYSSGDVIPGAHLADHLMRAEGIDFQKGDLMALINGSFVQAGIGLSARKSLHDLIASHSGAIGLGLPLMDMGAGWLEHARQKGTKWGLLELDTLGDLYTLYGSKAQASVSWRSVPQTQAILLKAMNRWECELQDALSSPSGNPLFLGDSFTPASQASFLALDLSIATSHLIEVLLYCAGQSVQRCQYLLSGVYGLPKDGAYSDTSLGLIQVPKKMTAKVLDLHSRYGHRPIVHLATTSYGIEDSCSMGTMMMHYLKDVVKILSVVLKDEARVYRQLRAVQSAMRN